MTAFPLPRTLAVVDTHTAGEPTRVLLDLDGARFPTLATGAAVERRARFAAEFDALRKAVVEEPRGHEAVVGAVVLPPAEAGSVAAVVFFNNRGPLGMCGHGTAGVAVALAHAGAIDPGTHRLDTPAGPVPFTLHDDRRTVTLTNVPSFRYASGVEVDVGRGGRSQLVVGDVAWGGNWFFLADAAGRALEPGNLGSLLHATKRIKAMLAEQGVTGADGAEIDHVELCGPPADPANSGRNFVLCPGGAYDRSPCGTGTSAKLACLAADGKLAPGEVWRQESVIGSLFEASYQPGPPTADGTPTVRPALTATAFVTGENLLHFDAADPFRGGFV
ncbi:proline racemase family protein [Alienimonas californiensis]|uniref:4-hydroxyproline epimerase n=1 Tax=Alienimonas californiensis TaxID=2527989 RepID=A0A517P745_9PLAN|nr:proline racemase family protein [Alienimonas californiensis]QDT15190.1 4-hydroxyproline epimerase [Alienimonas californiensis]